MSSVVLDASALLALLRLEPGHKVVSRSIADAAVSAVNLSEVYAKAVEHGLGLEATHLVMAGLPLQIVTFDHEQALIAGRLRMETRDKGLSLGDRCCLAAGISSKLPVLTADRRWDGLALGIEIRMIR